MLELVADLVAEIPSSDLEPLLDSEIESAVNAGAELLEGDLDDLGATPYRLSLFAYPGTLRDPLDRFLLLIPACGHFLSLEYKSSLGVGSTARSPQ